MKISSLDEIPSVHSYLVRVGAEPRSLRTAVVRETRGQYWTDVAVIRFSLAGEVSCNSLAHAPTENEAAAIARDWRAYDFPKIKTLPHLRNAPPMIANAEKEDVFVFRTEDDDGIIMVQVRLEKDGEKSYVPWTFWDDDQWRCSEPEGDLPLWGLEQLKGHKTVFLHEGAKGARNCRDIINSKNPDHPWASEMVGAAHLGWIGGALNPGRTDWSPLARAGVERVYIIADNDAPGKSAVAAVAARMSVATFSVEFNGRFPPGFDLGDPFPAGMFDAAAGHRFYSGPPMRSLLNPATWATDQIPNPNGKGRPINALRESFRKMWAYVEESDVFVCTEMPEITLSESVFNKVVAPFSHAQNTAAILVRSYKGRSARLCYRPDAPTRLVDHRGANAINLYVPPAIKPREGSAAPWEEFLDYLFILPGERKEAARWLATLIAKPAVRMGYGLLLVSETQGVGKTTLGAKVLAPLIGINNTSFPGESDIVNPFNEWVAHKRLAVVNEIYSGASWKAYNSLKSVITDQEVVVNQKYMRQYTIDNWCHVVACSNSRRALKMENDDRRWFYPQVTEVPWPATKFVSFRRWIEGGGLEIIRNWAEKFKDYVGPAERAPMTESKREMIEGSRSEAQGLAAELGAALAEHENGGALLTKDVVGWIRSQAHGTVFDSDYELRRAMTEGGARLWPERIKIRGWLQHAIVNEGLFDELQRLKEDDQWKKALRDAVLKPTELMEEGM